MNAVQLIRLKWAMRKDARERKPPVAEKPKMSMAPFWGGNAQKLCFRLFGSTDRNVAWNHYHPAPPQLKILHPNYKWNGTPVARRGSPPGIVWHHAAGLGSPEAINQVHLNIGDRGIAYHFYIRRDGRVYAGRPENTMGAHCLGHNDCIGVCLEGNYEAHDDMPTAQLKAAQAVHSYLHKKYGQPDWQHKNMSGNSTACPGKFYQFGKITG